MKVLLFDIDGTLLFPGKTPRLCIDQALSRVINRPVNLSIDKLAGFTDPVIIENALRQYGISDGRISEFKEKVLKEYLRLLQERYPMADDKRLYPHVRETLQLLSEKKDIVPGLLTGNVREGAGIKLAPFNIWHYFQEGVFGDDAPKRNLLPPVALKRFRKITGQNLNPTDFIVIGDTHRDIEMAKVNGLRSVAVLHNKKWTEKILNAKPDLLIDGFHQLDQFITFINSG